MNLLKQLLLASITTFFISAVVKNVIYVSSLIDVILVAIFCLQGDFIKIRLKCTVHPISLTNFDFVPSCLKVFIRSLLLSKLTKIAEISTPNHTIVL